MSALDEYLARAGDGAVLMVSPIALDDIKANAAPRDWQWSPRGRALYRGALVEVHDEWSWGWMVRDAKGRILEAIAPIEAGTGETAQPVRSEGRKRDQLQNKDRDHD